MNTKPVHVAVCGRARLTWQEQSSPWDRYTLRLGSGSFHLGGLDDYGLGDSVMLFHGRMEFNPFL